MKQGIKVCSAIGEVKVSLVWIKIKLLSFGIYILNKFHIPKYYLIP